MNKQELRQHFLECRNRLEPQERARWSQQICEMLHSFEMLKQAKTIAAYYPLGSEVDLCPLLELWEQEGKRLVLPISYKDGKMVFHEARLAALEQGMYGIFQPPEHSAVVKPAEIECIVVPGVAFDDAGGRIGYGKGYYDRILQQYQGTAIGVCFAAQVTELVPVEAHDIPLHYLANEQRIHQIRI